MDIIELIKEEVLKRVEKDILIKGYNSWEEHIKYVVKNAKELAIKYNADQEIVELGALLHDIAVVSNIGPQQEHHINGSIIAEELLNKYNYPKDRIERVKQCVLNHSASKELQRNTIEEEIIADADAMAHFDKIPGLFFVAYKRRNLDIKDASNWVKTKLENDYNKLSDRAKLELKSRYENIIKVLFAENE